MMADAWRARAKDDPARKYAKSQYEWVILVATKDHGNTRAVLKKTTDTEVLALQNTAGSVAYIPIRLELP
jgi:hypothetical protein